MSNIGFDAGISVVRLHIRMEKLLFYSALTFPDSYPQASGGVCIPCLPHGSPHARIETEVQTLFGPTHELDMV